jgi:hypothetical protein
MKGITISPKPLMYALAPIPIPLNCVGYSSPANGYMIRNDADIVNFANKNNTKVATTASVKTYNYQFISLKK